MHALALLQMKQDYFLQTIHSVCMMYKWIMSFTYVLSINYLIVCAQVDSGHSEFSVQTVWLVAV